MWWITFFYCRLSKEVEACLKRVSPILNEPVDLCESNFITVYFNVIDGKHQISHSLNNKMVTTLFKILNVISFKYHEKHQINLKVYIQKWLSITFNHWILYKAVWHSWTSNYSQVYKTSYDNELKLTGKLLLTKLYWIVILSLVKSFSSCVNV